MMEKNTKDLIWFNDSLFNAKFNTEQIVSLLSVMLDRHFRDELETSKERALWGNLFYSEMRALINSICEYANKTHETLCELNDETKKIYR